MGGAMRLALDKPVRNVGVAIDVQRSAALQVHKGGVGLRLEQSYGHVLARPVV